MLLASTARAATLLDPTPAENDFFGSAVTLAGGNLLVGARFDDTAASDAGAAYLLDAATGALLTTLLEPAPAASDQFGAAVAAVGSDLLVGAPHFNSGAAHAGAVFVFQSGGGVRTLTKPTPAFDDLFGFALAAAGDTVVVGAPFDGSGAPGAGAAYLFDARTGALVQTLANPTPADYDLFGDAVAAAGGIVVVGAPFDDTTKPNAGSAYVFDAATGALRHTLQAPHPREGDLFGSAVAASDTTIVVGAPFDDTVAANAGAVHLFDAATGALLHTLLNPASDVDSRFGSAVAIAGGTVLVGAPFDDTDAADAGIAYLFDVASGTLLTTFENPTPSPGDQFGASLAMAGNVVAIGSWLDDTAAPGGGAVYVFGNDASPPGSTTTTTLPPTTTTVTTTSSTVSTPATSTPCTGTTTSATTSSSAPAGTTTTTTSTPTTLTPPVVTCTTVC